MCCALWGKMLSLGSDTRLWGMPKICLWSARLLGFRHGGGSPCLQLSEAKKIKGPKRRGLAFFSWSMEPKAVFLLVFTQGTKCTMGLLKACFLPAASGNRETQFFQREPMARWGQGCLYSRAACFYLSPRTWEPRGWQDAEPPCEVYVENNLRFPLDHTKHFVSNEPKRSL